MFPGAEGSKVMFPGAEGSKVMFLVAEGDKFNSVGRIPTDQFNKNFASL